MSGYLHAPADLLLRKGNLVPQEWEAGGLQSVSGSLGGRRIEPRFFQFIACFVLRFGSFLSLFLGLFNDVFFNYLSHVMLEGKGFGRRRKINSKLTFVIIFIYPSKTEENYSASQLG